MRICSRKGLGTRLAHPKYMYVIVEPHLVLEKVVQSSHSQAAANCIVWFVGLCEEPRLLSAAAFLQLFGVPSVCEATPQRAKALVCFAGMGWAPIAFRLVTTYSFRQAVRRKRSEHEQCTLMQSLQTRGRYTHTLRSRATNLGSHAFSLETVKKVFYNTRTVARPHLPSHRYAVHPPGIVT